MTTPSLTVMPPGIAADESRPLAAPGVVAELPDQIIKLTPAEKKIWDHVTADLYKYGLIHRTDAMVLTVICKTFRQWVDAEDYLRKIEKENGSIYVKTPNGFEQPHQAFYVAKDLKRQLKGWLSDAALTLESFHKIKSQGAQVQQPDLFDDPIDDFRRRKTAMGLRVVGSGDAQ